MFSALNLELLHDAASVHFCRSITRAGIHVTDHLVAMRSIRSAVQLYVCMCVWKMTSE